MDERNDFQQMMERIDRSNRRQARYGFLQCFFSIIAALCCIAMLLLILSALPQLQQMADQASNILSNLENMTFLEFMAKLNRTIEKAEREAKCNVQNAEASTLEALQEAQVTTYLLINSIVVNVLNLLMK